MRILIVEDEPTLNKTLNELLGEYGYQTDIAESLKDGEYFCEIRNYDLIIINYLLTDGVVTDFMTNIKSKMPKAQIVILSSKHKKEFELEAFKYGADDFIVKPVDYEILLARIGARLKFWGSNTINIGDIIINPDEERISYKGKEIEVKGKPFEVLTHLARHQDQIVSKEQLLDAIWEEPELVTPNVIEVAINQIRQKMDKPLEITTIETVRRRGYRFCYPKK
ncbi:DNA-binding response regulator [Helicobacter enhydrae]|uniref:DNA-binding response regulator n=1 Tax=Helicobacter enhydrae TaxID=222136 RepID=A0A1B1U6M3_9HELI|nr:homeostatic response regulator transcription factor HsrA [Helicobacter enhydrae]ANV98444.1 DNA-binding response regulator [Helicobacter enhydrae]